jgi:hypothetical protein
MPSTLLFPFSYMQEEDRAQREKKETARQSQELSPFVFTVKLVPAAMPVMLITIDNWHPSIIVECRLRDLMGEGLLRPVTSSTRSERIAPPAEHRERNPPEGYVAGFIKFHRHGFGSPPSRFVRALLHHYGVDLWHLSPNAISNAAIFTVVCEGYLGVMPH